VLAVWSYVSSIIGRAIGVLTVVFLLTELVTGGDPPKPASSQDAAEWLERARKTLTSSYTAEWEATLEVIEASPVAMQERKYAFHVGPMRYRFRVKGNSRAYWAEQ